MKSNYKMLLLSLLMGGMTFSNVGSVAHASTIKEASYRNVCPGMVGISNLGAVDVVASNGNTYKTHYARAFDSCMSAQYKYYTQTTGVSNIFYRTDYGGIVTYQHIPQKNYREYTSGNNWHWGQLKENADINATKKYYKYWGVKLNTVACRDRDEATCSTKLATPNTHHEFYYDTSSGLYKNKGGAGETRYLGYSANGTSMLSAYLPLDNSGGTETWSDLSKYPFDADVFNTPSNAYFKPTKTKYDNNYSTKRAAVERLLNDIPELKNLGGVDSWMNRVSLRTDPFSEAPVFEATRGNGTRYIAITLVTPSQFNRNVSLVEMRIETVIDGKTHVAAKMTRNDNDGNVSVSFGTYNGKTIELEQGKKYKVKVVVKNTSPSKVQLSGANYVIYNNGSETSKGSDLGYGQTQTFEFDYTAPKKSTDTIYAKVGPSYGANNQQYHDDDASLTINLKAAPEGDLKVVKAELVEVKTNKVVKYPVQGMEYYIRYYTKYVGETMPDLFDINLRAEINTYEPSKNDGSLVNKIVTTTLDSKPATTELKDNKDIIFESGKFVATSSKITTTYTIISPNYEHTINKDTSNDKGSATFEEKFDIAVVPGSVVIQPGNYPGGDYCKPLVIKFKLNYTVPVGHTYHEAQTVKVAFNVGGKLAETTIQVFANQGAKEYTYTFDNGCVNANANGNVDVSIKVNPYHTLHESNYGNNQLNKEWVKKTYPQDYCSTQTREKNEWSQKYYVVTINENALGPDLDEFVSDRNIDEIRQKETMKITSVQFYSKYMKDKNMGTKGWVEVLGSNGKQNSTIPTIKAGYGFDIKVTVEYETDAFSTEERALAMYMKSNETLYNPHTFTTFDDDFYLALKKAGSSDVVISAKGGKNQSGTKVIPSRSAKGSEKNKITWTYTFENVQISEKTPDGTYNLALYTKPITGVISKTEGATNVGVLCDYLNVQFKVNGSVYDDIITGTIQ